MARFSDEDNFFSYTGDGMDRMCVRVVRRFLAGTNPVLEKLRKGKGSAPIQKHQLFGVLEELGFRVETGIQWAKSDFGDVQPLEYLDAIRRSERSTLPSNPRKGERVYLNVEVKGGQVHAEQWNAEEADKLTAPSGATASFAAEGLKVAPAMWKWLKAQPAYMAAMVSEAAPPSPAAPGRGPTPQRTLENTGTCPCCFKRQKLKNGRMVLHGYKAPGLGAGFQGNCFGVGYPPFEVSTEGTQEYKKKIEAKVEEAKSFVERVRRGDVEALPHPTFNTRKLRKEDATPEEWAWAIDKAVPLAQRQVTIYEEEVERLGAIIEKWPRMPW